MPCGTTRCGCSKLAAREREAERGRRWREHAERARHSFNRAVLVRAGRLSVRRRRWRERETTRRCRPNQLFAISLDYPGARPRALGSRCSICREQLLTRVACGRCPGNPITSRSTTAICARDAAYHQGTVWAWLIGPFVDAWLKVHPERSQQAARAL